MNINLGKFSLCIGRVPFYWRPVYARYWVDWLGVYVGVIQVRFGW